MRFARIVDKSWDWHTVSMYSGLGLGAKFWIVSKPNIFKAMSIQPVQCLLYTMYTKYISNTEQLEDNNMYVDFIKNYIL